MGVLLLQGEGPLAVIGPFSQDERLDDATQGFGAELSVRNDDGLVRRLGGYARVDGRYIPGSKRLSWIGCTACRYARKSGPLAILRASIDAGLRQ